MKRIVFVDDEPNVLDGLKRMLRGMRQEWDLHFVESGPAALELMSRQRCDVVVSDMRMPGMDGAELLARVRELFPHTVRLVLSGFSDRQAIMKTVKPAHQYLAKPCEPAKLKAVIRRACLLSTFLEERSLTDMVASLDILPALPDIYHRLVAELASENASLKSVASIASQDMGLTATLLKLVNSSFFGPPRRVTTVSEAVGLLGLDIIKDLAVSAHVFATFNTRQTPGFSFEDLWRHCQNTAAIAKTIAKDLGASKSIVEDAFLGGLLHDVGKLILASAASEKYNRVLEAVRADNQLIWQAERRVLGTSHAEVGGYLMGLWGLNEEVVEAIGYHHHPRDLGGQALHPLIAVHLADLVEHEVNVWHADYARREVDRSYLAELRLEEKLQGWLHHFGDLAAREDENG